MSGIAHNVKDALTPGHHHHHEGEETAAEYTWGRGGDSAPHTSGDIPGGTESGGNVRGGRIMEGGDRDTTRSDYDRGEETRSMPETSGGAGEFGLGGRTASDPTGIGGGSIGGERPKQHSHFGSQGGGMAGFVPAGSSAGGAQGTTESEHKEESHKEEGHTSSSYKKTGGDF